MTQSPDQEQERGVLGQKVSNLGRWQKEAPATSVEPGLENEFDKSGLHSGQKGHQATLTTRQQKQLDRARDEVDEDTNNLSVANRNMTAVLALKVREGTDPQSQKLGTDRARPISMTPTQEIERIDRMLKSLMGFEGAGAALINPAEAEAHLKQHGKEVADRLAHMGIWTKEFAERLESGRMSLAQFTTVLQRIVDTNPLDPALTQLEGQRQKLAHEVERAETLLELAESTLALTGQDPAQQAARASSVDQARANVGIKRAQRN